MRRATGARRAGTPRGARATCGIALVLAAATATGCARHEVRAYADGALRSEGDATRVRHEPDGAWTWWYPNGEPRERGTYADGVRVGTWTQWWPNGQLRSRGERRFDASRRASVREGAWTFWHPNGVRSASGVYRAGERTGRWECSIEDGSLDGEASGVYVDGVRVDGP